MQSKTKTKSEDI